MMLSNVVCITVVCFCWGEIAVDGSHGNKRSHNHGPAWIDHCWDHAPSLLLDPFCPLYKDCGDPPVVVHGSHGALTRNTDGGIRIHTTYTCDNDYVMTGSDVITCNLTTTAETSPSWSVAPVCNERTCDEPFTISNGHILDFANTTDIGTVVTYTCDDSYVISGNDTSVCLPDLTWSKPLPICTEIVCPEVPTIANGNVYGNYSNTSSVGTVVDYVCIDGYTFVNTSTVECTTTGSWSVPQPQCGPSVCGVPPTVDNGYILKQANIHVIGSYVTYECITGYSMAGNDSIQCLGDVTGDVSWSRPLPQCVEIVCGLPPTLAHGTFSLPSNTDTVTVTMTTITDIPPTSVDNVTDMLPGNNNDNDTDTFKSTADYANVTELPLLSNETGMFATTATNTNVTELPLLSNETGMFATTATKTNVTEIVTTQVTVETPSSTVTERATTQVTVTLPTSTMGGPATSTLPTRLTTPVTVTLSTSTLGGPATSTLPTGLTPSSTVTERATTQVTVTLPTSTMGKREVMTLPTGLTPTAADEISLPSNFNEGDIATYTCNEGFRMSGNDTTVCMNGHWIGQPTCHRKPVCDSPAPTVANSVMKVVENTTSSIIISYTCIESFKLSGTETLACVNSTWESEPPTCECIVKPLDIVFIADGSSSVGYDGFEDTKRFLIDIVNLYPNDTTRFGFLQFSHNLELEFQLDTFNNSDEVKEEIQNTTLLTGSTRTFDALSFSRTDMFTAANGMRPNITHIAIVITDGLSDSKNMTLEQAQLLKDEGVVIYSVGVGSGIDMDELRGMASEDDYVFNVDNYGEIHTVLSSLSDATCLSFIGRRRNESVGLGRI